MSLLLQCHEHELGARANAHAEQQREGRRAQHVGVHQLPAALLLQHSEGEGEGKVRVGVRVR